MPRPLFTPGERTTGTHCTGDWVGHRAGQDTEVKGKILLPLPGIESPSSGRPSRSQTLYWLSYPDSSWQSSLQKITYFPDMWLIVPFDSATNQSCVMFKFLMEISKKMTAFLELCSLIEVDRRFRGAYCVHNICPDDGRSSDLLTPRSTWRDQTALCPRRLSCS
jgi:hypothetical protein